MQLRYSRLGLSRATRLPARELCDLRVEPHDRRSQAAASLEDHFRAQAWQKGGTPLSSLAVLTSRLRRRRTSTRPLKTAGVSILGTEHKTPDRCTHEGHHVRNDPFAFTARS